MSDDSNKAPPGFRVVGMSGPGVNLSASSWWRLRPDGEPARIGGVSKLTWDSGGYDILEPLPAEQPAPKDGYCTRCKEDVVIAGHKCPPWRGVCACNAGDPVFHSHYREDPHSCARCSECNAFQPELPAEQPAIRQCKPGCGTTLMAGGGPMTCHDVFGTPDDAECFCEDGIAWCSTGCKFAGQPMLPAEQPAPTMCPGDSIHPPHEKRTGCYQQVWWPPTAEHPAPTGHAATCAGQFRNGPGVLSCDCGFSKVSEGMGQAAPDGGRLLQDAVEAAAALSARLDIAKFEQGTRSRDDEVAALEARLAAAQERADTAQRCMDDALRQRDAAIRERDEMKEARDIGVVNARSDERARCLAHFRRRHGTALISFLEEDIASGKPAP